jgi:hypothetical protein
VEEGLDTVAAAAVVVISVQTLQRRASQRKKKIPKDCKGKKIPKGLQRKLFSQRI